MPLFNNILKVGKVGRANGDGVCVGGAWSIADDALSDMLAGPFLFCVLRVHPGPLPLPFIELRVSQRFPNTTFPCKNWGGRV